MYFMVIYWSHEICIYKFESFYWFNYFLLITLLFVFSCSQKEWNMVIHINIHNININVEM